MASACDCDKKPHSRPTVGVLRASQMRRATRFTLLAALIAGAAACATVKPWQREHLASRAMAIGFGEEGFAGEYRAKVTETKTGGGLPGAAPGGGCGCTQ